MSVRESTAGTPVRATRYAGLLAWFAGRQRGRWATCRGRWIKTLLTAALLVTALSAWAVALVQPWMGRSEDWDIPPTGFGLDMEKVRSASADVEKLLPQYVPPTPKPLRRNLFEGARPVAASPPASPAARDVPAPVRPEAESGPPAAKSTVPEPMSQAGPAPTAKKVLETLKGLRLEVILMTPAGDRWAVINGESYREGDAVAGLEIVEIQEGRVRLQKAGMTGLLRMD